MISPKVKVKSPKLADYQKIIVDSDKNTITEATSKGGKTHSHIWWLFRESQQKHVQPNWNYWWIAPIYEQAKIAFNRIAAKIKGNPSYTVYNSSPHTIVTPKGTKIVFKSADDPDSLYGEDVYGVVIDEGSRMKEDAFTAILSTTTFTDGKIRAIGNMKGIDNWYYKFCRKVQDGKLPTWEYHKFTADDAIREGILKQSKLDEFRAILPEGVFNELYYCIPFVNMGNRFAFSFKTEKHISETKYNPDYPLYLSFDFNRNPICCAAFQHYNDRIFGVESIKLPNSDIYKLCDVIKMKYPKTLFIVNGDATGQASSALVRDNLNYYKVIRTQLNLSPNQIKIPTVNPGIAENQVLVNSILEHYKISLDPTNCAPLIHDLQFVEMLPDGSIKKGDREDPNQQADSLDCFRYYLNANFKWFLKTWQGN